MSGVSSDRTPVSASKEAAPDEAPRETAGLQFVDDLPIVIPDVAQRRSGIGDVLYPVRPPHSVTPGERSETRGLLVSRAKMQFDGRLKTDPPL